MKRAVWIAVALVHLLAVAACGGDRAPSCDDLEWHVSSLFGKKQRPNNQIMYALELGRRCRDKQLSVEQRRCVVAAKALDDTFACGTHHFDVVAELTSFSAPVSTGPFGGMMWRRKDKVSSLFWELCKREATIPAWCEYTTKQYPGVIFRVFRDPMMELKGEYPLGALRITLARNGLKERLTAAWGQPREVNGTSFWFNPRVPVRLALNAAKMPGDPPGMIDLELDRYETLEGIIAPGDKQRFGFEGDTSLLGESAERVRKRFAPHVGSGRIRLSPLETGARAVEIILDSEITNEMPDRVEHFQIKLHGASSEEIRKLLEKKFGAPRQDGAELVFRDEPRVTLDGDSINVGTF